MNRAEDRDLAHEADMRALYREQLRNDISAEEANDEMAERNAEGTYDYDDYDDYDELTDEDLEDYEDRDWLSPSDYEASQS